MERVKADAVVLGTGGAGMAAAITAAEGGAKVVLLEKRPFPGGASNTPVAIGSMRNDQAYKDKGFKIFMEMTHWTGNADLVRAWINKSAELMDWLKRMGVEYASVAKQSLETMGEEMGERGGFPRGYNINDTYFLKAEGKGHGGSVMIKKLVARAKDLGVDVRMSTPGKKILKVGNRIAGVHAEDKAGNLIHIDADAVIVATAGFNDDAEMVKQYSNYGFTLDRFGTCVEGDFFNLCLGTKFTGDGVKMAWEVGADKGSISVEPFNHVPGPGIIGNMPWIMLSQARIIQEQPYLWVNQQGRRFIDEGLMNDHFTSGGVVGRQKGKCASIIFDEETKKRMEQVGVDFIYFVFPAKTLTDIEGDLRKVIAQGNRHVFIAETLDDLAKQMDMDPAALKETVDQYNGFCEKGHDGQFAKNPKFLHPVKASKFYGIRTYNTAYQSIGGIKVNGKTEALTKDGEVIPGLYAAGDIAAAELFGDPPTLGIGNLSFALSSGLIAAESALKYVKGLH
jgi:fumarate reductase flavoprotein subunit